MAKKTKEPAAIPGDIVQIIIPKRRELLVVVEEVRAWGVTGYAPWAKGMDEPAAHMPTRLRYGEFVRVGVVGIGTKELADARAAAIETARLIAEEAKQK